MMERDEYVQISQDLLTIPFYPRDEHATVLKALSRITSSPERLTWLVETAAANWRTWMGIAELRGLYCSRWSPDDGKYESCTTPGFTPEDNEAAYFESQSGETAARIEEWKSEAKQLPPAEQEANRKLQLVVREAIDSKTSQ
jgi:hypothetical protein